MVFKFGAVPVQKHGGHHALGSKRSAVYGASSELALLNPLNTKLSCWNFNLVNADQLSRE